MQINEGTHAQTVSSDSSMSPLSDPEDADGRNNWMDWLPELLPNPIAIPAPDPWLVHGHAMRANQLEIQIKQLKIAKLRVEVQLLRYNAP